MTVSKLQCHYDKRVKNKSGRTGWNFMSKEKECSFSYGPLKVIHLNLNYSYHTWHHLLINLEVLLEAQHWMAHRWMMSFC